MENKVSKNMQYTRMKRKKTLIYSLEKASGQECLYQRSMSETGNPASQGKALKSLSLGSATLLSAGCAIFAIIPTCFSYFYLL